MANPLITANPNVMMGKPVVAGTRITVELILEKLAAGEPVEQILRAHPRLTEEGLRAAIRYALDVLRSDVIYLSGADRGVKILTDEGSKRKMSTGFARAAIRVAFVSETDPGLDNRALFLLLVDHHLAPRAPARFLGQSLSQIQVMKARASFGNATSYLATGPAEPRESPIRCIASRRDPS